MAPERLLSVWAKTAGSRDRETASPKTGRVVLRTNDDRDGNPGQKPNGFQGSLLSVGRPCGHQEAGNRRGWCAIGREDSHNLPRSALCK